MIDLNDDEKKIYQELRKKLYDKNYELNTSESKRFDEETHTKMVEELKQIKKEITSFLSKKTLEEGKEK
jgi:hypothetical protein